MRPWTCGVLRLPPAQRVADEQAWQDEYANLPADDYPSLHRVRDQLPQMGQSAVEPALDLLIAAMRQEAAERVG